MYIGRHVRSLRIHWETCDDYVYIGKHVRSLRVRSLRVHGETCEKLMYTLGKL